MPAYSLLAEYYDSFIDSDFYSDYLAKIKEIIKIFGASPVTCLDIACGTGRLTSLLSKSGFDMTAADISEDMLSIAFQNCRNDKNILFLHQSMQELDLNDTVDLCVCSLDGINHLLSGDDIMLAFKRIHLFLNEGGIFIFDINTPYKFKTEFQNDYILENDNALLCWQNEREKDIYNFYISVFAENKSGLYERFDDMITERCYTPLYLTKMLKKAGFSKTEIFSADTEIPSKPLKNDKRQFIAAVK